MGVPFLWYLSLGKQRKVLARVRFKPFEVRRLRRAKQRASLSAC